MRLNKDSAIVTCLAAGLLTVLAAGSQAAETPGPAFTRGTFQECTPVEGAAPAASVSVPELPTGPKEFAVDRPRPQKDMVVSVRDFGADSERDDNSEAFAQAIQHCKEKKASTLVVPNGVYRFQVGQPALEIKVGERPRPGKPFWTVFPEIPVKNHNSCKEPVRRLLFS